MTWYYALTILGAVVTFLWHISKRYKWRNTYAEAGEVIVVAKDALKDGSLSKTDIANIIMKALEVLLDKK